MASVNYVEEAPKRTGEPTPHLPKGHPDFVPTPDTKEGPTAVRVKEAVFSLPYAPVSVNTSGYTVIILNGPPGCGKDTIAEEMRNTIGFHKCSFKEPMFTIALSASGISELDWWSRYYDRSLKEEPWDRLGGLSCREFLIKISEEWIKPVFGPNAFSKLAFSQVKPGVSVFSDGGFSEEFNEMVAEFGRRNVKLVRLHRDGYSFAGDSRDYLQGEDWGVDVLDYSIRDGEVGHAVSTILEAFKL